MPYWRRSGVFIVNFGHISHLVLVFILLTLGRQMSAEITLLLFWMAIIVSDAKEIIVQ